MKQNRLNFLQKNLPVLLIALFLTAVPGFIAAMDLETQLGTLQGSLVALKGKLGQLKGGLENIKDVLEGKTLSSGGGSSLSSNPDVADAIQKIDTAFLTTLGVKHGPKTCEAIQNLLKDNELNLIITQIKALSVENTNTVKLLFGHKDFLTTLTKQSISASNAEAILNQGIYLTQVIEALTIENKLITPKASFAPSLTLQSIWGAKNAQFKSKVIGLALSLFFQNQSIKTKQEKFAYIAQLELLEKLKDNANIKTLAKEIAKANKGSVDYPMNLDELKNFEDTNLPKILGDLKYNLEIDTINQVITEITTIANKSTVLAALPAGGAGGPPPIVGMLPAKAPLTPEDFTTLANNADLLSGTSDKKDGFFTEVIKNKIKDKVQKTLKASDKDIVTAGVLADTLETLQQNLGLKKAVSSGADPSPAQPGVKKPVASDPEGYKGIWKNLETSLSNPIAFKNALDKAIAKIADNEKMKKTLNKIPGLHNFLIVMDSTRPQEPIINLLKNKWQPIFEKIIANPAIKTWFIEQMKLDKSIPKQGVVYTGNPDFKETDWDTRANAILAAKAAPAKNSGGFGGGGNSLGGSVASGYKDGMIDTLDLDPEHYKYLWNLPELQNELTQIKEYLNSLFPMGSAYPAPLIDEAVDTIAGAYFEKYVLAQCKWFLNKQDTDRTNSSNNPNWVQEKYFKYIYDALKSNQPYQVDDVDAKNQFIENVLKRTVKRTDTAAKTMFYEPGTSQAVRCQCLPLRILANTEMNTDAAIDKNNPILKPLLYLIY